MLASQAAAAAASGGMHLGMSLTSPCRVVPGHFAQVGVVLDCYNPSMSVSLGTRDVVFAP